MMMNRNGPSIWVRIVAILLAAGFLIGSLVIGFTATGSYNLLEVFGNDQQSQQQQTQDLGPQIADAEQNLEENPKDPDAITGLAGLYLTDNQTGEAISVLEDGMEAAPDNPDIPLLLGQSYGSQAQAQPEGEREEAFRQAGDAFAAATERDSENADAFLGAGSAYEQAGESGKAIQYYNGYLDLEPDSDQASEVKDQIDTLLDEGGSSGSEDSGESGGSGEGGSSGGEGSSE